MGKIKTAKAFLTVNKIFSIFEIVIVAFFIFVAPFVFLFMGGLFGSMVSIANTQNAQETTDAILENMGLVILIVEGVLLTILAHVIISLVFACKAKKGIKKAQNHADIVKPGVLAIIAGVFFGLFAIPAGILLLTTKDSDYPVEKKE